LPRKPADNIIEHRIDLSPFLRKQLEQATEAEKWKDYADVANKAVLPVAAVGVGTGCVLAACAFMHWTGLTITQIANATGRIVKGTANLVTDPFDTLFGVGVHIGEDLFGNLRKEPQKPRRWPRIMAIANRMELLSTRLNALGGASADPKSLEHYTYTYDLEVESLLKEMEGFSIVPAANQFAFRENFRQYMKSTGYFTVLGPGAPSAIKLTQEWRKSNLMTAFDLSFGT